MKTNDPALLRRGRQPLVGYVGQDNPLHVVDLHDRTRVQTNWRTRAFLLAASLLFGPAFALVFLADPRYFTAQPLFIQAFIAGTIGFMTILFVRTLIRRPRFEILQSGDIVVQDPSIHIRREDVRGVVIETDMYADSDHRIFTPNSVLVLRTADGDVRLCASPDLKLIETLADRVAALTRTELKS